jgi:hypothetical protein
VYCRGEIRLTPVCKSINFQNVSLHFCILLWTVYYFIAGKRNSWMSWARNKILYCNSVSNQLNEISPWSRVPFEKLVVAQLFKEFHALYGTRRFVTVFTTACYFSGCCITLRNTLFFCGEELLASAQPSCWMNTACCLSATDQCMHSLRVWMSSSSLSARGLAVPWSQETYLTRAISCWIIF